MNVSKVLLRCALLLAIPCAVSAGWVQQNSRTTMDLSGVWFLPDARTGYAGGGNGLILKTTDAGVTWDSLPQVVGWVDAVCFPVNAETGFVAASGGRILRTTNAGANWQAETSGVSYDLRGISFPRDNQTGYVVGGNDTAAVILKTTDGGSSWVRQTANALHPITSVWFPQDARTGFACGWAGVILKTTDGGGSWLSQTSHTTADLSAIRFPTDAATGFVAGSGGTILKTTDGGTNWIPETTRVFDYLSSASFPVDAETGYAAGAAGKILKTTDGGWHWTTQATPVTDFLSSIHFPVDCRIGFAVGRNGVILRTTDGGSWIQEPEKQVACEREYAAYPNPFSSYTLITSGNASLNPTRATIFDVSGTLVRELVLPGCNGKGVLWNGRDRSGRRVPDGVYVLKVESRNPVPLRIVKSR